MGFYSVAGKNANDILSSLRYFHAESTSTRFGLGRFEKARKRINITELLQAYEWYLIVL
jgi:hypothetical protein